MCCIFAIHYIFRWFEPWRMSYAKGVCKHAGSNELNNRLILAYLLISLNGSI